MNVIDIIILIFLAFGAVLGFKRGFTRELVSILGIFVVLFLSFTLKNPISVLLYNNLPFFNFGGIFKDVTVLNILVYEAISFLIVFIGLSIILKLILAFTKVFEKILNFTIILGIPSKILGAILGIVQNIIYAFIILYILSFPIFDIMNVLKKENFQSEVNKAINESKFANTILNNTPVLTNVCDKTLQAFEKIVELKDEYNNTNNLDEYNQKVVNIMIENKIVTKENIQKLIDRKKIKNIEIG